VTLIKKARSEYADDQFWEELPKVIEKLEREKKALDKQTRKN